MNRRMFLQNGSAAGALSLARSRRILLAEAADIGDRDYWVRLLTKTAQPVLNALSQRTLKQTMPVEAPHQNVAERSRYTHLEAFARLLMGIAPWMESGPATGSEAALRLHYSGLAREALDAATDLTSPDSMNFCAGSQPLVDTAFLALAIMRAPNTLWEKLDDRVRRNTIAALTSSRVITPPQSNWLLFPAMIEAALARMGATWQAPRIDEAIRKFETWYKGDGIYGDGPNLHCDYYNSFVIHPMLLNILDAIAPYSASWNIFAERIMQRAVRYAEIQERTIAPDGSFPPLGRSLSYRFGAFHLLAEIALRGRLPEGIQPAQVRSALTAVMRRMAEAPGTFDENGWLRIGFYGHQPEIAETYISTGSCYLCSTVWLPLGRSAEDPFWSSKAASWTAKKAWGESTVTADHALES
jgi:hypothetical protein